jgi:hypothetical protein
MPSQAPSRIMVVGTGTAAFFDATNAQRTEVFLPRFRQMIADWGELGARMVASFCDDVFQMGQADAPFWSWYLIFEVDEIDIAAQMIQASRQPVDGNRLDRWIRLEVRFGRPFFAAEETTPHHVVDPDSEAYVPDRAATDTP